VIPLLKTYSPGLKTSSNISQDELDRILGQVEIIPLRQGDGQREYQSQH